MKLRNKLSDFTPHSTGGGCMAWRRDSDDGRYYVLITDSDGTGLGDDTTTQWLVGVYTDARAVPDRYSDAITVLGIDAARTRALAMLAAPEEHLPTVEEVQAECAAHGGHRDTGRGVCACCGKALV